MRDTLISQLTALAKKDPSIVLITGDLGFGVLNDYANDLPGQFLNAGVAEQNMTGIATGLALEGKKVFTYSIGNFNTLRCLEQIRNDISTMNYTTRILLPTIVLGNANPSSPNPNVIYRAMGYGLTKATFKESPGYWMQGEEDRGTNNPEIAIKSQPSYGTATIAPNGEDIMFTINTSLFTFMPEDQYDQIEIYSKPLNFENIGQFFQLQQSMNLLLIFLHFEFLIY